MESAKRAIKKPSQMERKRIGELLVEQGYVTPYQLTRALEVQKTRGERICSILMDLGHLSEEAFFKFLSDMPGVAGVDLSGCDLDRETLELVPADVAMRLEVIPIGKIGNLLTLAMVCPIDEEGLKEIESATSLKVRPMLCSREAVHNALERHYSNSAQIDGQRQQNNDLSGVGNSMRLHRVGKFVEEIEELPTLPDILGIISSIVNDPTSSAADLARVIASDSSLSTKILKVANSVAYGFLREVSDIQQAVALLGFRETQALALSVSIFNYLNGLAAIELKEYWNHSLGCATLAKLISLNLRASGLEAAFVAGLIHDIGKVALTMSMPDNHEKINLFCSTGETDRLEAEERVFGLTHAEAGYLLGEHWLLPANLTSAIRYHHSPEVKNGTEDLTSVVWLANTFSKMDPSKLKVQPTLSDDVLCILKTLGLSESAFRTTLSAYSCLIPEAVLL